MRLDALSGRDRQICRTMLEMMRRENISVDEALVLVSAPREITADQTRTERTSGYGICPDPECGQQLVRCPRTGQIYCAKCRYSVIGDGK